MELGFHTKKTDPDLKIFRVLIRNPALTKYTVSYVEVTPKHLFKPKPCKLTGKGKKKFIFLQPPFFTFVHPSSPNTIKITIHKVFVLFLSYYIFNYIFKLPKLANEVNIQTRRCMPKLVKTKFYVGGGGETRIQSKYQDSEKKILVQIFNWHNNFILRFQLDETV